MKHIHGVSPREPVAPQEKPSLLTVLAQKDA